MLNELAPAIENYQLSLTLNPNNTECYYNLGNAYCILEQYTDALHAFENSIRIDKNNASAYYNIGISYYIIYYILYIMDYIRQHPADSEQLRECDVQLRTVPWSIRGKGKQRMVQLHRIGVPG